MDTFASIPFHDLNIAPPAYKATPSRPRTRRTSGTTTHIHVQIHQPAHSVRLLNSYFVHRICMDYTSEIRACQAPFRVFLSHTQNFSKTPARAPFQDDGKTPQASPFRPRDHPPKTPRDLPRPPQSAFRGSRSAMVMPDSARSITTRSTSCTISGSSAAVISSSSSISGCIEHGAHQRHALLLTA